MVSPAREEGFVLPLVILMLLVLTGLAHAVLASARIQDVMARGERDAFRSRETASGALSEWLDTVDPTEFPLREGWAGAVEETVRIPGGWEGRVIVVRLGPEWFWLEVRGRPADGSTAGGRAEGIAMWSLSPVERESRVQATLEAGGQVAPAPTDADNRFGSRPAVAALDGATVDESGIPRLGLMDGEMLRARAGSGRTDASSDRSDPRIVVLARPSAALEEDVVGVVVAEGDLTVAPGTRITGVALVAGRLRIQAGAELVGHARVGGDVTIQTGGTVAGSPDAVRSVLRGLPALRRPLALPGTPRLVIP